MLARFKHSAQCIIVKHLIGVSMLEKDFYQLYHLQTLCQRLLSSNFAVPGLEQARIRCGGTMRGDRR